MKEKLIGKVAKRRAIAKGCGKNVLKLQETCVSLFIAKLNECTPCLENTRKLVQPFTGKEALPAVRRDLLHSEEKGENVAAMYIQTHYCNAMHTIADERKPMKRTVLSTFKADKKPSKEEALVRKQKDVLEVLAHHAVKAASTGVSSQLVGSQVTRLPLLFCEEDGTMHKSNKKTDLRGYLEKTCRSAFACGIKLKEANHSAIFLDSMQDIISSPLNFKATFYDYFIQFWNLKVKNSFKIANTVCAVFDAQDRGLSPKDTTRTARDGIGDIGADVGEIEDITPLPTGNDWSTFLRNRGNKKKLVHFLVKKLAESGERLQDGKILFVSSEKDVICVTSQGSTGIQSLTNNHEEADTRIFYLIRELDFKENIIRSIDTDLFFVYLCNHQFLNNHQIYMQYSKAGGKYDIKYVNFNKLAECLDQHSDPTTARELMLIKASTPSCANLIGVLHFLSGCDDLSSFRSISKTKILNAMINHAPFIMEGFEAMSLQEIFSPENVEKCAVILTKLISASFRERYSGCFDYRIPLAELVCTSGATDASMKELLTSVRQKTWHMTLTDRNTVPSLDAVIDSGL